MIDNNLVDGVKRLHLLEPALRLLVQTGIGQRLLMDFYTCRLDLGEIRYHSDQTQDAAALPLTRILCLAFDTEPACCPVRPHNAHLGFDRTGRSCAIVSLQRRARWARSSAWTRPIALSKVMDSPAPMPRIVRTRI